MYSVLYGTGKIGEVSCTRPIPVRPPVIAATLPTRSWGRDILFCRFCRVWRSMEYVLTQWCQWCYVSITSAIAMAMQLQLSKAQFALKFLPCPSPFYPQLRNSYSSTPRRGKSAIRSISPWWSGLGVMMPRVCCAEVSTFFMND